MKILRDKITAALEADDREAILPLLREVAALLVDRDTLLQRHRETSYRLWQVEEAARQFVAGETTLENLQGELARWEARDQAELTRLGFVGQQTHPADAAAAAGMAPEVVEQIRATADQQVRTIVVGNLRAFVARVVDEFGGDAPPTYELLDPQEDDPTIDDARLVELLHECGGEVFD